jgi:hypothetical protein
MKRTHIRAEHPNESSSSRRTQTFVSSSSPRIPTFECKSRLREPCKSRLPEPRKSCATCGGSDVLISLFRVEDVDGKCPPFYVCVTCLDAPHPVLVACTRSGCFAKMSPSEPVRICSTCPPTVSARSGLCGRHFRHCVMCNQTRCDTCHARHLCACGVCDTQPAFVSYRESVASHGLGVVATPFCHFCSQQKTRMTHLWVHDARQPTRCWPDHYDVCCCCERLERVKTLRLATIASAGESDPSAHRFGENHHTCYCGQIVCRDEVSALVRLKCANPCCLSKPNTFTHFSAYSVPIHALHALHHSVSDVTHHSVSDSTHHSVSGAKTNVANLVCCQCAFWSIRPLMTPHVSVITSSVPRLLPPLVTIVATYLGDADPIDALYIDLERELQTRDGLFDPSGYTAAVRQYVGARDEHPGHGRPSDLVMFFHRIAPQTWDADGIRDRLLQPLAYRMWRNRHEHPYAATDPRRHAYEQAVFHTARAREKKTHTTSLLQ